MGGIIDDAGEAISCYENRTSVGYTIRRDAFDQVTLEMNNVVGVSLSYNKSALSLEKVSLACSSDEVPMTTPLRPESEFK